MLFDALVLAILGFVALITGRFLRLSSPPVRSRVIDAEGLRWPDGTTTDLSRDTRPDALSTAEVLGRHIIRERGER